ncbi:hypothetical protein [Telmatospirillum sp. J64-1]|uniref:hypothetical protein n=1 Tax=Telmatospirillum sp. J64-1 TaxID=2502183 RepID=UPI00115D7B6A|nr:hypothetical protein [Telmatospirillum sp. J64-1]
MFGLFSLFGRSRDIQLLDASLRDVGLHPRLVPDAVKITTMKLLKEACAGNPDPAATARAAEVLAYCMLGWQSFGDSNDPHLSETVRQRIDTATEEGDSLDARLVMLTLQAGVIQPSVIDRHGLEIT